MKKKNIILLIIAIVMFILVGSTMAYFGWSSSAENKDQLVDVTVAGGTGSCDKLSDNNKLLYPTSTREKGRILKVTTKQQMATNAFVTWNLVVNSINETTLTTSGLKHKSFKYELVNDTTGVSYGTGSFENVTNGTTITLSTDKETLDYNKEYTFILYLWIDGTIGNNPLDMTNQPYNFDLNCNITGTSTKVTPPVPTNMVQYIRYLYNNAEKKTVTNNGINYNTAPSVRLMSDRLGGTTTDLEGGNVRYYGNPQSEIVPAWQSDRTSILANGVFGSAFTSESNCSSMLTALTTCSANYSALGFSSASECEAGLPALLKSMANVSTVSELITEYCTNDTYPLNNYIYFNCSDYSNQSSSTCETWRIIGIFDGKVKIMRNNTIGKLAWDYDKNNNSSLTTYDNNWHTSTLQKLLNNSYYNGTGTITYYNSDSANGSVSLNMNNIGIKNTKTRNMISETNWYLGGSDTISDFQSNQFYQYERGIQKCSSCTYEIIWKGNIALPYVSDYSYSSDFSICTDTPSAYVCRGTNWMYPIMTADGTQNSWLLTPDSGDSYSAWIVNSDGGVYYSINAYVALGAVPVLYLSSELGIESGDGSESNPYKLNA
jgi:hypothetical protein